MELKRKKVFLYHLYHNVCYVCYVSARLIKSFLLVFFIKPSRPSKLAENLLKDLKLKYYLMEISNYATRFARYLFA